MTIPAPEPGLVIRYTFLWADEHAAGREEGTTDRPCAIVVVSVHDITGKEQAVVLPITHSPPNDPKSAIEIPSAVKRHLQLDGERSWVVLIETNEFTWPGPDLQRIGDRTRGPFSYGFLPPRLFAEIRRRYVELERLDRVRHVPRTE